VLHLLPLLLPAAVAATAATTLAATIAATDLNLHLEKPVLLFRSLESLGRTNWMLSLPNSTTWTMHQVILPQERVCLLQLLQETMHLPLLLIPKIFEPRRE